MVATRGSKGVGDKKADDVSAPVRRSRRTKSVGGQAAQEVEAETTSDGKRSRRRTRSLAPVVNDDASNDDESDDDDTAMTSTTTTTTTQEDSKVDAAMEEDSDDDDDAPEETTNSNVKDEMLRQMELENEQQRIEDEKKAKRQDLKAARQRAQVEEKKLKEKKRKELEKEEDSDALPAALLNTVAQLKSKKQKMEAAPSGVHHRLTQNPTHGAMDVNALFETDGTKRMHGFNVVLLDGTKNGKKRRNAKKEQGRFVSHAAPTYAVTGKGVHQNRAAETEGRVFLKGSAKSINSNKQRADTLLYMSGRKRGPAMEFCR